MDSGLMEEQKDIDKLLFTTMAFNRILLQDNLTIAQIRADVDRLNLEIEFTDSDDELTQWLDAEVARINAK